MTFIEHIQKLRAETILRVWNSNQFTNKERVILQKGLKRNEFPFKEIIIKGLILK